MTMTEANSVRLVMMRRRRLRRARGAVLVEAAIVSAMLMTLMAGGLFLHRLYATKIKVMNDARTAGFSQALQGCNSAVDLNAIWAETGASSAPIEVETSSAPAFFGSVGHTSGSASERATAHGRVGGGSYTLSTTNSLACNEIPQGERGDVIDLLGYIQASVITSDF
jgi:hypothetical protein